MKKQIFTLIELLVNATCLMGKIITYPCFPPSSFIFADIYSKAVEHCVEHLLIPVL